MNQKEIQNHFITIAKNLRFAVIDFENDTEKDFKDFHGCTKKQMNKAIDNIKVN